MKRNEKTNKTSTLLSFSFLNVNVHCWKTKKCNGKNKNRKGSIHCYDSFLTHKNLTSTSC